MNTPKNISVSVKARLQNVAATRGEDFNLLLLRYGIERLLFRLSQSPHADRFLLKGAMLFVVWDEKTHRPTRDLDLLGFGSTEKADLIQVFAAVAAVPVVDDGIVFDPKSVQADDIREDNAYGVRRMATSRENTAGRHSSASRLLPVAVQERRIWDARTRWRSKGGRQGHLVRNWRGPPRHGGGIGSTRSGTGLRRALRAEGRVNFAENDRPNNEQFGNDHSASLDI